MATRDFRPNGCSRPIENLTNERFGRLTVVEFSGKRRTLSLWRCLCDCGKEKVVYSTNLKRGYTQSCGCIQKEKVLAFHANEDNTGTVGGKAKKMPEYSNWLSMKRRCYNQKTALFHLWGGRGITVCDQWRDSFATFLKDMGPRPSSKHSIDRIDNSLNYSPDNCRWATQTEQCRNKRDNVLLTYKGETLCLADWVDKTGLTYPCLYTRYVTLGWIPEESIEGKHI